MDRRLNDRLPLRYEGVPNWPIVTNAHNKCVAAVQAALSAAPARAVNG
ncbi:MAG: hypothetical protein JNL83_21285 [Myxococcales bacterium]|nr:hypothetical protein [Myxococcales bacterium]